MRALKLIRGKKPSFAPIIFAAKPECLRVGMTESNDSKSELVWQPRPEWLRKPRRQNLWN